MPINYRNSTSSRQYASACAFVSKLLHKVKSSNKSLVKCGDFNSDLKDTVAYFTHLLLSSMPSDIILLSNSKSFSCVHHSCSTSDLDFVLSNILELQYSIVDKSDEMLTSDRLHLKFRMHLSIPKISQQPQWFWKKHWNNIDKPLYQ